MGKTCAGTRRRVVRKEPELARLGSSGATAVTPGRRSLHPPRAQRAAAGLPTALRKSDRSQGRGVRRCGCGRGRAGSALEKGLLAWPAPREDGRTPARASVKHQPWSRPRARPDCRGGPRRGAVGRLLRRQSRDCSSVLPAQWRSETSGTNQSRTHAARESDRAARVLEAETPFNDGAGTVSFRKRVKN